MNQDALNRNQKIIRCSLIGVGMNLFLAVFKIIVGTMANARAIIMDGINSLSDMTASLISIISSVFVKKRGNKDHPFGYGRMEYLSSLLVAMIILYVGYRSIYGSVYAIIHSHTPPAYNALTLVIMVVSLISKLLYGIFTHRQGKRLNSATLVLSAADSLGDALISLGILVAILLYRFYGVDIEHYLSIAISLLIIRTGIKMIHECGNRILGTRPDPELRKALIRQVMQNPDVLNISNIALHDYGEGNYVGSVDIEVDEKLTAVEISILSRQIIRQAENLGVRLTSVGIVGTNITDPASVEIWDTMIELARKYSSIKRLYSFIIDRENREISFYITQDSALKQNICEEELERFRQQLCDTFPDMRIEIHQGIDI